MALQRSFSSLLNEYVTGEVLTESLVKRMWFFNEVEHKKNWKNGTYPVPFEGNPPTSMLALGPGRVCWACEIPGRHQ